MELVRTWVRWTSTALGAALLLPGAVMIVAAGVAVGGGGLGGIGALGQLVEGPRDPLATLAALDPADDTLAADPSALIASAPPGDLGSTGGGSGGVRGGSEGGGQPGGDNGGGRDESGGGGGGTPGGGDGPGAPITTPPKREPEPGSGPLQPVEDGAGQVVEQLPEPVGPLSGDVIDQVVELGEDLLGQPDGGGLLGSLDGTP